MAEFFEALSRQTFLQYALLTGLLVSVACGVVGTYVVARRISYIAGGIAHCVLGGMGAARYLETVAGWRWMHPLYGAVAAALIAAVIIGLVSIRYGIAIVINLTDIIAITIVFGVEGTRITEVWDEIAVGIHIVISPSTDILVVGDTIAVCVQFYC